MSAGCRIEVMYVDGRCQRYDGGQTTIVGSGHDAEISIRAEELSPRHLLIMPRTAGCWISVARDATTPVLWNGTNVDNQEVPWGTELDIGTLTLRVSEPTIKVQGRARKKRMWLYAMLAAGTTLTLLWALQEEVVHPPTPPANAPLLLADSAVCTVDSDHARRRAMHRRSEAHTYWQRYHFDSQQGIRAAAFLAEARACAEMLGDDALAAATDKQYQEVAGTIERDYQSLRLQLVRSLAERDDASASDCVFRLARMTAHTQSTYAEWLTRVERYLAHHPAPGKNGS